MYFLEILCKTYLSMNTIIILNFSGATPLPLNFSGKPLHIVIFVKKKIIFDLKIQCWLIPLFSAAVKVCSWWKLSLSFKLAQKLGNISRKLTFQSFWWAPKYPTVDVWWYMGAKLLFVQKDTLSYIYVLFFHATRNQVLVYTSRIKIKSKSQVLSY